VLVGQLEVMLTRCRQTDLGERTLYRTFGGIDGAVAVISAPADGANVVLCRRAEGVDVIGEAGRA
jgi:hypothetical protein